MEICNLIPKYQWMKNRTPRTQEYFMPLSCFIPIKSHRISEVFKETGKNIHDLRALCASAYQKGIYQDCKFTLLDDFSPIWALKTIGTKETI